MAVLRGTVTAVVSASGTASVRFDGTANQVVSGIRYSTALAASIVAGKRVLVDTGDHNDTADFIVTAMFA
jgi:hypothetical protein